MTDSSRRSFLFGGAAIGAAAFTLGGVATRQAWHDAQAAFQAINLKCGNFDASNVSDMFVNFGKASSIAMSEHYNSFYPALRRFTDSRHTKSMNSVVKYIKSFNQTQRGMRFSQKPPIIEGDTIFISNDDIRELQANIHRVEAIPFILSCNRQNEINIDDPEDTHDNIMKGLSHNDAVVREIVLQNLIANTDVSPTSRPNSFYQNPENIKFVEKLLIACADNINASQIFFHGTTYLKNVQLICHIHKYEKVEKQIQSSLEKVEKIDCGNLTIASRGLSKIDLSNSFNTLPQSFDALLKWETLKTKVNDDYLAWAALQHIKILQLAFDASNENLLKASQNQKGTEELKCWKLLGFLRSFKTYEELIVPKFDRGKLDQVKEDKRFYTFAKDELPEILENQSAFNSEPHSQSQIQAIKHLGNFHYSTYQDMIPQNARVELHNSCEDFFRGESRWNTLEKKILGTAVNAGYASGMIASGDRAMKEVSGYNNLMNPVKERLLHHYTNLKKSIQDQP